MPKLTRGLRAQLETLMDALAEQFGTAAEFEDPKGGIFLWVKRPTSWTRKEAGAGVVGERRRHQSGPEWSTDKGYSRTGCGSVSPVHHDGIRQGVAVLAEVCRREFGVPERIANVARRAQA